MCAIVSRDGQMSDKPKQKRTVANDYSALGESLGDNAIEG
jgi:hypothetical protein